MECWLVKDGQIGYLKAHGHFPSRSLGPCKGSFSSWDNWVNVLLTSGLKTLMQPNNLFHTIRPQTKNIAWRHKALSKAYTWPLQRFTLLSEANERVLLSAPWFNTYQMHRCGLVWWSFDCETKECSLKALALFQTGCIPLAKVRGLAHGVHGRYLKSASWFALHYMQPHGTCLHNVSAV